jgi:hypothetical protein
MLFVFAYFAHLEACACAMLFLSLWILFTRQWRRIWTFVPTIALTAWYVLARLGHHNADAAEVPLDTYRYGSRMFFIFRGSTFFKIFGYVNSGTVDGRSYLETLVGKPGMILLLVMCAAITLLTLYCVIRAAWALRHTQTYFTIFILFLIFVTAVIPQIFLGSTDPGSRLTLMAVAIGLFLINWRQPVAKAIAVLSVAFGLMNLYQFVRVEHQPQLVGHVVDMPKKLTTFGHIEPTRTIFYYDHLELGEMNLHIFETAMFLITHTVPLQ